MNNKKWNIVLGLIIAAILLTIGGCVKTKINNARASRPATKINQQLAQMQHIELSSTAWSPPIVVEGWQRFQWETWGEGAILIKDADTGTIHRASGAPLMTKGIRRFQFMVDPKSPRDKKVILAYAIK